MSPNDRKACRIVARLIGEDPARFDPISNSTHKARMVKRFKLEAKPYRTGDWAVYMDGERTPFLFSGHIHEGTILTNAVCYAHDKKWYDKPEAPGDGLPTEPAPRPVRVPKHEMTLAWRLYVKGERRIIERAHFDERLTMRRADREEIHALVLECIERAGGFPSDLIAGSQADCRPMRILRS